MNASKSALLLGMLIFAGGCDDSTRTCTLDARTGLIVTVRGAADPDGGTIGVRVTDGDYEEDLSCSPQDGSLVCSGATERPGTYHIEVVANGEVVATDEVTVDEDECHVITERVEI